MDTTVLPAIGFPAKAFLPAKTVRQKLARLFNAKTYNPSDIRAIRSSVYYSAIKGSGSAKAPMTLSYIMSVAHALRQNDGRFVVYTSATQVQEDPVRRQFHREDIAAAPDHAVLCDEDHVIEHLTRMEDAIVRDRKVVYELAFPARDPLNLGDSLHIESARLIFNHTNTRDEIIHKQKLIRHNLDRPVSYKPL